MTSAAELLYPPKPLSGKEIVAASKFATTGKVNLELLQRPGVAARAQQMLLQRWGNGATMPKHILLAAGTLGLLK